jgi:hypothetical protein
VPRNKAEALMGAVVVVPFRLFQGWAYSLEIW